MIKRMIILIALIAVVITAFFFYKKHQMTSGMAAMMASFKPPVVSTAKVTSQEWQPNFSAVGSLRAVNGADLSSEVSGIVESLSFESGSEADKDAVLVQLRAEDDIAKLHALQANQNIAQINYDRDVKQLKAQAVAQAVVDTDKATLDNTKAQTAAQQALVDKKTIRAPFAGRLGIRLVDIGQFVNPGTAIVTLQQLDPIYIDFPLPEQAMPLIKLGQNITLNTDAYPDQKFNGKITAINSRIDEATRNIVVRATLDNADHKLLPGMFGNVMVDSGAPVKYLTLPQTAVVYNTYGSTVYLVKKNDDGDGKQPPFKVQQSVVVTGDTRGDQVAVTSGVKEGEEVVSSGQVKLRNGMGVSINNDVQPADDAAPTPHEQ